MKKYILHTENQKIFEKEDILYHFLSRIKLSINGFGHQFGDTGYNYCDNRINTDFELIYVIAGENEIEIEGEIYHGKAGDLFLIPPFCKHDIHTTHQNPHDNYWIHFDIEPFYLSDQLQQSIMGNRGGYCEGIGEKVELIRFFGQIEKERKEMLPGYRTMQQNIFQNIITYLLRIKIGKEEKFTNISKREYRIMAQASEYINENMNRFITVGEVAKNLHISEPYLYKIFANIIHISPNAYMKLLRAKKAKLLIETTDKSLNDIAEELGFSTYYYFSNFFKKVYGQSPKQYRK
ncbi:MAG: AraC family transcriptional regulator [Eubacteriales bacterium]